MGVVTPARTLPVVLGDVMGDTVRVAEEQGPSLLSSVYVVERYSQTWSPAELVAVFSTYERAQAWRDAYVQTHTSALAQRITIAEWYVDAAAWPEPVPADNPDDPDPFDGRFFEGRLQVAEVLEVYGLDGYGRREL